MKGKWRKLKHGETLNETQFVVRIIKQADGKKAPYVTIGLYGWECSPYWTPFGVNITHAMHTKNTVIKTQVTGFGQSHPYSSSIHS